MAVNATRDPQPAQSTKRGPQAMALGATITNNQALAKLDQVFAKAKLVNAQFIPTDKVNVVAPEGMLVSGQVVDEVGNPMPFAFVESMPDKSSPGVETSADASGHFSLRWSLGQGSLRALAENGKSGISRPLSESNDDAVRIVVRKALSLSGTVANFHPAGPMPIVEIRPVTLGPIDDEYQSTWYATLQTMPSADGAFSIDLIGQGVYRVTARQGLAKSTTTTVQILEDAATPYARLDLGQVRPFYFTAQDASGNPIPQVRIENDDVFTDQYGSAVLWINSKDDSWAYAHGFRSTNFSTAEDSARVTLQKMDVTHDDLYVPTDEELASELYDESDLDEQEEADFEEGDDDSYPRQYEAALSMEIDGSAWTVNHYNGTLPKGVFPGDEVLLINGKSPTYDDLTGPKNSTMELKIRRPATGNVFTITVPRTQEYIEEPGC